MPAILKKTGANVIFWLRCSRVYALPMTLLSWSVAFIYSLQHGGDILSGILVLPGIALMHLATNLIDDLLDYPLLMKNEEFRRHAPETKCDYLTSGSTNLQRMCLCIVLFIGMAGAIGLFLAWYSGPWVFAFMLGGLAIALSYQWCSLHGLGEASVFTAYGPLFFCGVYYVMTSSFSAEVLLLAVSCASFVASVLYAHMIMDFEGDQSHGKLTLPLVVGSKSGALVGLLLFYTLGYSATIVMALQTGKLVYLLPLLTLPLVMDFYLSLRRYIADKLHLPIIRPWHYPLDNWSEMSRTPDAPFFFRIYYVRNIATFYVALTALACGI